MNQSIVTQLYFVLIYCLSGCIIGIFFDIFRVLRKSFQTSNWMTYLEDILFWLGTGIFLLMIIFGLGEGEIRFYAIVALILGFVLYLLTLSKYFIRININIMNIIKKIVSSILFPIKFSILLCKNKILRPLFNILNKKLHKIAKFYKKDPNRIKKQKKSKKSVTERRILQRNVEKYNRTHLKSKEKLERRRKNEFI